jgi:mono/diheme cytochrome c family protein
MWVVITVIAILTSIHACEKGNSNSGNSNNSWPRQAMLARGKYLVEIASCNDCHSVGYVESSGKLQETEWLTGSPIGYKGPWGTTYPSNLLLSVQNMRETAWVQMCRSRTGMPPMPWLSMNKMSDVDLMAIHRYIYQLGPRGVSAPLMVESEQEPQTPYFDFNPKHMERLKLVSTK